MAFNFTAFLGDLGSGLGAFLTAITNPLVEIIVVLGVIGGVIYLFYAIGGMVKGSMRK